MTGSCYDPSMAACIQLTHLTKRYGAMTAVDSLSLDINSGEVFGLLGPNGAGKSTTLYMLTGLVRPTSGRVTIFGRDLQRNFVEIMARVGVLVERPAFHENLSVAKNLILFSLLSRKQVTIDRALDFVGLLHVKHERVSELSQGMRQRLGLAQAFLTEPELLILDEPTNGLDVEHTHEILKLLRRLADESGVTIVISSHMMHEVETLCDRVAIVNKGRLVSCSRTDVLISYDSSNIEVLIDVPEAAARRLREQAWVESVEVNPGRIHVRLVDVTAHHLTAFLVGQGYKIMGVIPRRRTLQEYFLKVLNS